MRKLGLLLFVGFLVGCASQPVVDTDIPRGTPVYWTESGIPGEYQEITIVRGIASGPCNESEGVFNAAIMDAVRKAEALGADGILIPDSITARGVEQNSDCVKQPVNSLACVCTFGISGIIQMLMPKRGTSEVTAVAINIID